MNLQSVKKLSVLKLDDFYETLSAGSMPSLLTTNKSKHDSNMTKMSS